MAIQERIEEIITKFNQFDDWEDRYRELIKLGKSLPEMTESYKTEDNKVKGCQSQVWLHPTFSEGIIKFEGDSDAAIVKGIVGVLLYVYSESTPMEILSAKPTFIDDIGLRQHLSMSRANGLNSMLKKISIYAMAFQAKANM
jgi:cysteine desulfuration protein SufE